ncbi:MAG: hypothetical protein RL497_3162 [Pseudomonadota bacterium]|jgi:tryptophan halogenase
MSQLGSIVILGGGTAGWLAGALLSQHLGQSCCITLVESQELGTIGLGESTVPPFVGLIKSLGMDEREFVQATGATYKLGIEFLDWQHKQTRYFHPFGSLGARIYSQDFYQCWLKARAQGIAAPLQNFSPCQVMAREGRFWPPGMAQHTPIGGANYALHVDASRVAEVLKTYALARDLKHQQGQVHSVSRRDNGFIHSLKLDTGIEIEGDFFIDCTGFKSLLLDKTLGVEFEDWSAYLPCDRAVVLRGEAQSGVVPYTQARARDSGWSWRIPLQHRTGEGYVYASAFCSDNKACETLLAGIKQPLEAPRVLPFTTGHRREFWRGNCLGLGLAAGFIEPLEATAIHLIARGLDFFLRFLPEANCHPSLSRAYNQRMSADFREVRDFVQLHYVTSQRTDSAFWRHCQQLPLADSLQERIELFKAQGLVSEQGDDLFRASSWQAVFEGMGIQPRHYSPKVAHLQEAQLKEELQKTEAAILAMVKTLPKHEAFLRGDMG